MLDADDTQGDFLEWLANELEFPPLPTKYTDTADSQHYAAFVINSTIIDAIDYGNWEYLEVDSCCSLEEEYMQSIFDSTDSKQSYTEPEYSTSTDDSEQSYTEPSTDESEDGWSFSTDTYWPMVGYSIAWSCWGSCSFSQCDCQNAQGDERFDYFPLYDSYKNRHQDAITSCHQHKLRNQKIMENVCAKSKNSLACLHSDVRDRRWLPNRKKVQALKYLYMDTSKYYRRRQRTRKQKIDYSEYTVFHTKNKFCKQQY